MNSLDREVCWTMARRAPGLLLLLTGGLTWLVPCRVQRVQRVQLRAVGPEVRGYAQGLPLEPGYTGPAYTGPASVNDAFVDHLLNMYKTQGKLPMKYAYMMALDVLELLKQEKSLQRVAVPPGSKITVVGDLHGQYFDFVHMIEQDSAFVVLNTLTAARRV